MKILILTDSATTTGVKSLKAEASKRGYEVTVLSPSEISLYVSNAVNGWDRAHEQSGKQLTRIGRTDYDYVIVRAGKDLRYAAMVVDHLRNNLGIFTSAKGESLLNASNKFKTLQLCSQFGLPTPKSILISKSTKNIESLVKQLGGAPIIVKQLGGSKGIGVSILESKVSIKSNIDSFHKAGVTIMLQEFIEAKGKDIRALVVGNTVVASYERTSPKGDFRANMSLGGEGAPIELTAEQRVICVKAAKAVGLSVAGVDLIRDAKGKIYVVEVNGNPGFQIEKVTGVSISKHILDFADKEMVEFRKRRQVVKDRASDLESIINSLTEEHRKLYYFLKPFSESEYLNSWFKKNQGRKLDYHDREGNPKRKLIRTRRDLLMIISETFKINK